MNGGQSYGDPALGGSEQLTESAIPYLTDETYDQVVRALPIPCADIILLVERDGVVDKALWLAMRNVFPHRDWWVIGGRLKFSDGSLEEAASRNLLRETGVSIEPRRFRYLTTSLFSWYRTKQHVDQPGKNLAAALVCVVSLEEIRAISRGLVSEEYAAEIGLQRFDREKLIRTDVHPVLVDFYDMLFPSLKRRALAALRALFGQIWT